MLWIAAASAAVLVAAAGAGGYVLASGGTSPHPTSSGNNGNNAPEITSPARIADGYFTSPPGETASGLTTHVTATAADGDTDVVTGWQQGAGGNIDRGLILVSRDSGHTWRLADVHAPGGGPPSLGPYPAGVTHGPHRWIAVGAEYGSDAVWTSQNGVSWTQYPVSGLGEGTVSQVAATDSGYVAVGSTDSVQTAVWTSANGRQWHLYTPKFGGELNIGSNVLAAHGNQVVVDVEAGPAMGSVWHSADGGRTWQHVQLPKVPRLELTSYNGVASGPSGLYVYGSGDNPTTGATDFVLGSTRGSHWSILLNAALPQSAGGAFTGFAASSSGFAGAIGAGDNSQVLYRSSGRSWRNAGDMHASQFGVGFVSMAASGGSVITAGVAGHGNSQTPALFVAAPAPTGVNLGAIPHVMFTARQALSVAESGGQAVVAGDANGSAAIWYGHGYSWQRAAVSAPPGQLAAVAPGPHGWLAVGTGPQTSGSTEVEVLASADGRSWRSLAGQRAFKAPNLNTILSLTGVASSGAGSVIVGTKTAGTKPDQPGAWFSSNGDTWRGPVTLPSSGQYPAPSGVAATSSGFVAIGSANGPGGKVLPLAWRSANGRTWSRISLPLPPGLSGQSFGKVVASGSELVVFGSASGTHGRGVAVVDVSRDGGHTWQAFSVPHSQYSYATTAAEVTPAGAAATYSIGPGSQQSVLLVSATGSLTSWSAVRPQGTGMSGPDNQLVNGLAGDGDSLIGVGSTNNYATMHTTLWETALPR